jgi:hypothetical protein
MVQSVGKIYQGCAWGYSDYLNGSLLAKLNMDNFLHVPSLQGYLTVSPKLKISIFIVLFNLYSHSSSSMLNAIYTKPKWVTYRDVDPPASSIQSL